MGRKKLEIKCPDFKECTINIDKETFENYCCRKNRSPSECWAYRDRHTIRKTPLQWIKTKNLPTGF